MTSAVIVGAGAIGGWLADALFHAGWNVGLLARGDTLAALRRDGLRVAQQGVSRTCRPQAGSAAQLGAHDYVLLCVKAQQLPSLAPLLAPLVSAKSTVVSATNGIPWWFLHDFGGLLANRTLASVDPEGAQSRQFERHAALGGVVHASVRTVAPGQVEVKAADRLILGEPDGSMSLRLQELVLAFRAGGIQASASGAIRKDVWSKLLGNMCINPVSALTRASTARLFADSAVRMLLADMMGEMQQIGARLGLDLGVSPADRIGIAERLGDFKTSMLTDVEAGRPLELSPQLGALVEMAEMLRIDTPKMRTVLALATLLST